MRLYWLTLAVVCFILGAARASALPPEPIVDALADATHPVLAIDPTTGEPHAAYVNSGTLYHAWKSGGAWLTEPVATGVTASPVDYGDAIDLRVSIDGRVYAFYAQSGSFVFAERGPGGWEPTPLEAYPSTIRFGSLAASPATGEPVVAWASRPAAGQPYDVKIARRVGGSWTTQVLDTTSASFWMVAVAVDAADRPRVAWACPRADAASSVVLTCALASGPTGPWVPAVVDSELASSNYSSLSMALDATSGEPRIAYTGRSIANQWTARYAALDAGAWQVTTVEPGGPAMRPPSLAIDPAGDPYVAVTEYTSIGPATLRGGDDPGLGSCVFVRTGDVVLLHRHGGAGTGPFAKFVYLHAPGEIDNVNGSRTLAAPFSGAVAAAWRSPGQLCAPFALSYALATPLAGVEPGLGAHVALGSVAPNPARVGASLRAPFELPRAAGTSFELHDVAGRLVAARALGRLGAGPHTLVWAPAAPRAGLYWLTLRADGARLGARAVVLAR